MGKFKVSPETMQKIREARSFMLTPPEHATPAPPEDWKKKLEAADKVYGPWKWMEKVTITKTTINEAVDTDDKTGAQIDRWDIQFSIDEGSETNAGRTHMEFMRVAEQADDGTLTAQTLRTFGVVDEIVTAAGVDYLLDDEGDEDYEQTFSDGLTNCEVMAKFAVGVRKRSDTGEYQEYCQIKEFSEVE